MKDFLSHEKSAELYGYIPVEEQDRIGEQNFVKVTFDTNNNAEFIIQRKRGFSNLRYNDGYSTTHIVDGSYRGLYSLSQLIELVPSTIYCNDEYNAVDINETNRYNKLKLHIIKNEDNNPDIKFKYTVVYKPETAFGIKRHIKIKRRDYKDPELSGDELTDLLMSLYLWCKNHGHIKGDGKKK